MLWQKFNVAARGAGPPQPNGSAASPRFLARCFQAVLKSPSSRPAERPRLWDRGCGVDTCCSPGERVACGGCCGGCSVRALAGTGLRGQEGTAVYGGSGAASPRLSHRWGHGRSGRCAVGHNQTPSKPWQGQCGGSEPGWGLRSHPGCPRSAAAGAPWRAGRADPGGTGGEGLRPDPKGGSSPFPPFPTPPRLFVLCPFVLLEVSRGLAGAEQSCRKLRNYNKWMSEQGKRVGVPSQG